MTNFTEYRGMYASLMLMGAVLAMSFMPCTASAQSSSSLQSILSVDGSIKQGVASGTFNARGYSMVLNRDGSPRFMKTQADPNDVNWDDSFTVPGSGGVVYALAVNGNYLYVGGSFGTVGNVIAHNIAKFDLTTRTWSQFDSAGVGTNSAVYCIVVNGADVYVGGNFSTAGSIAASRVAKWNATSGWSALGSGLSSTAYSMLFSGGVLFVTGSFTQAGGNSANFIAKWDGSSWSALGSGLNGMGELGLAIAQGDLFVCGSFTTAGGTTVNRVARWNGTTWSALGSGTPGTNGEVVDLIVVGDSVLYVGGNFTQAGGAAASHIAKYSIASDSWSALGGGLNGTVFGLAVAGNTLYVGGLFSTAGIISAKNVAKWDLTTASWSNVGDGTNSTVWTVSVTSGIVYAAGLFTEAGGTSAYGVASWDGTTWSPLTPSAGHGSVGGSVYAIAVRGDSVFVGGAFSTAGSSAALNVAIWDRATGQWSPLDDTPTQEGVDGSVFAILPTASGDVYVGGSFTQAGNTAVNNIVKWNPSTGWSALGSGTDGTVYGITMVSSNLYVCGNFTHAGGNAANYTAQWNGSSWSALGSGLSGSGYAIVLASGKIYVGGSFAQAGGNTVNQVASWDGSTWAGLGSSAGTDGTVYALAARGDTVLYAGGAFSNAGGSAASGIAKYSIASDSWSPLGGGLGNINDVRSVVISGDTLYAGGYFTTAGLLTANSIAVWNISTKAWSPVGSGTDGGIRAIAPGENSDLYVGGVFGLAGGKPSYRFGRYNQNPTPVDEPPIKPRTFALLQNYPNPFNPTTVISYQLSAVGHVTLTVYDILGRSVATLVDGVQSPGAYSIVFDGSRFASGVYFYRVVTGNNVQTRKMILMK